MRLAAISLRFGENPSAAGDGGTDPGRSDCKGARGRPGPAPQQPRTPWPPTWLLQHPRRSSFQLSFGYLAQKLAAAFFKHPHSSSGKKKKNNANVRDSIGRARRKAAEPHELCRKHVVVEGREGSLGTRPTHAPLLGFSGDSSVPAARCFPSVGLLLLRCWASRAGKFGTNWRRGRKSTQKYLPGTWAHR